MKTCTKCKENKPVTEFNKLSKAADGLQYHCKACKLVHQQANPRRKAAVAKYRDANKEACNARSVASQQKKRGYYNAKMREWTAANRERHLNTRRTWAKLNVAVESERKQRFAKRIQGAPCLTVAERAEIDGVYRFCQLFAGFEVDHIIPLQGKTVSGLHVPENLQALPIAVNRSKGNKFNAPEAYYA